MEEYGFFVDRDNSCLANVKSWGVDCLQDLDHIYDFCGVWEPAQRTWLPEDSDPPVTSFIRDMVLYMEFRHRLDYSWEAKKPFVIITLSTSGLHVTGHQKATGYSVLGLSQVSLFLHVIQLLVLIPMTPAPREILPTKTTNSITINISSNVHE